MLLAALVGLLTAELALRVVDWRAGRDASFFLPEEAYFLYQPHPYVGYVLVPGVERDHGGRRYRINSLGFRGAEREASKPEGTYRIFCLGGSTTFGELQRDDEKTYPAQLEAQLNQLAPPGVTYEVWNCGVSAYSTAETMINLQLRLLQYEPDAILVYHGVNDARPIQTRGYQPDYAHYRRSWVSHEISPFEASLLRHWRTFAWMTRGIDPEEQVTALGSRICWDNLRDQHIPASKKVNERGVEFFLGNLRTILGTARAHDIVPLLSTFASCSQLDRGTGGDLKRTLERINEEIIRLAAEEGVALVRVDEELSDRPDLFGDWVHVNDDGALRHAQTVVGAAREQGLFGL